MLYLKLKNCKIVNNLGTETGQSCAIPSCASRSCFRGIFLFLLSLLFNFIHMQVFAPKLGGLDCLAEAGTLLPLRTTVLFSSVAALLGTGGQASYAAANAGLDGWSSAAQSAGRSTVSVQWGAWASTGDPRYHPCPFVAVMVVGCYIILLRPALTYSTYY